MEKHVTRNIEEQLSAFLDGELPEEELALLVRRLERDEGHRATLDRYALIGGALRNEAALRAGGVMRRDIMTALDDSPAEVASVDQPDEKSSGIRYLLAASVAVVAVAVFFAGNLQTPQDMQALDAPVAAVVDSPAAIPVLAVQPAPAVVAVADKAELRERHQAELRRIRLNQERMRSYLISHGEHSSPLQGVIADSRMYVQQARFSE